MNDTTSSIRYDTSKKPSENRRLADKRSEPAPRPPSTWAFVSSCERGPLGTTGTVPNIPERVRCWSTASMIRMSSTLKKSVTDPPDS